MDCFGNTQKKWRLTWIIDDEKNPTSDDDSWNTYFKQAVTLLEAGKINEICVLFIAVEDVIGKVKRQTSCGFQKYIKSFNNPKKPAFKIVQRNIYDQNYRNAFNRGEQIDRDIGIYGKHLLFVYDNQDSTYGIYNENDGDINKHITFFDNVWNGADNV